MKSGIVTIVGRTNVGKSSLLNRLLAEKVSIVSPVVQTTRNVVRAVLNETRGQMALLDTPGVHRARNDLGKIMNQAARQAVRGADAALLVVDESERPWPEDEGWMRRLAREGLPLVIALNKCDLTPLRRRDYETLWQRACAPSAAEGAPTDVSAPPPDGNEPPVAFVPAWLEVSARTGAGLEDLVTALFESMPEGPPLFPEDLLTDFPRKLSVADVIREKLMVLVHDEIPHALAVQVEKLDDTVEPWEIEAAVLVNRHSQKGIVIGNKGRLIRKVQRQSEAELATIYEKSVRLRLRVKVQEHWAKNHWILKQLGYVP
jgi:GTPase